MYRILLALWIPASVLAQQQASGSLDGRVTNALTGEPVEGATLELVARLSVGMRRASPARSTTTSATDGSFRFEGLSAGTYSLSAQHAGFVSSTFDGHSQAVSISSDQQVSNLSIQLTPEGTISGKVTDENGETIPHARIQAFTSYNFQGKVMLRVKATATGNNAGAYTLENLPPDKYYVAADLTTATRESGQSSDTEQQRLEMVRTFYPKALDRPNATALDLLAGQNLADVNVYLRRIATYHVRGKLEGPSTDPVPKWMVSLIDRNENAFTQTKALRPDGTFDISGVVPGSYTIRVTGTDGQNGSLARVTAQQDIDISAEDVNGIALSPLQSLTLTGQATVDGMNSANLSAVRVELRPVGNTNARPITNIPVKNDGSFVISGVDPAEYVVRATGGPSGTYTKAITFNRRDVTNSVLDLSTGVSGEIEVIFRAGAADVTGTVQTSTSQMNASRTAVTVILLPDNLAPDGMGILFGYAAASGNFSVKSVPPGHYTAFAVESWNTIWQNPDFQNDMRKQGMSVEVEENGHPQIQLPLITSEQVQEEVSRLGLTMQ